MIAPVIVVLDKGCNSFLKFARHIVRQLINFTFEAAMVSLNLAIGLGMIGRSYNMSHTYQPQVLAKLPGKVAGAIIGEKHRPILHGHIRHAGNVHGLLDHINERVRCHIAL